MNNSKLKIQNTKLSILYAIMAYGPQIIASEVHSELGRHFRQNGHKFSVLSLEDYGDKGEAGATPFPQDEGEVPVYTIRFKNTLLRRILRKICQRVFHYGFFIELWWGYRKFLKAHRADFDVVHVEAAYPLGAVAALAAKSVKIPFIVNLQGADVMSLPAYDYGYGRYWMARRLLRLTFKRAAGVRANSEDTAELARHYGANPNKIRVILRNISETTYPDPSLDLADNKAQHKAELKQRYGLGDGPILMAYSRLHPFKGLDVLVKAVPLLKQQIGPFSLLICGPSRSTPGFGDYRRYLENLADKVGAREDIIFTGKINFAQSQAYLAGADLLVVPSIVDALNKVVLEAAAVGTPSVMTETTGAARHAVAAGVGVSVKVSDEQALVDGIVTALAQLDELGKHGPAFAKNFTADVIGTQMLDFYKAVTTPQIRLAYVAYPSSLTLKSANAIQTYTTCREITRRNPKAQVLIPRLPFRPSRFADIGAKHLPRLPFNFFNNFKPLKFVAWSYWERRWFTLEVGLYLLGRRLTGRGAKVIYVRDVICAYYLLKYWRKVLNCKIVYEAHDLEQRNPSRAKRRQKWAAKVDQVLMGQTDGLVSLTAAFENYVLAEGLRQKDQPTIVIPDAYDGEVYQPLDPAECRRLLGLDANEFIVVYSGLTFAYRNLDKLVQAFADFRHANPTVPASLLLLGGRDFERAAITQQAGQLNLSQSVKCVGQMPPDKVNLYLNAASALAIPDTVTDLTASPLKLFEYAAVARPIMLPDIPALKEILPESTAVYFERGSVAGMQAALEFICQQSAEAQQRGEAARQSVAHHTYANRAQSVLDFCQTVLAGEDKLTPTDEKYTPEYFAKQISKSDAKAAQQYGQLIKYAGISATSHPRFLDAGCGAGPALGFLQKQGFDVTGSDFVLYPLEIAHQRTPTVKLVNSDLRAGLPFADASFDVVLASEVIEHLAEADQFLAECRRVLAPGGYLILTTPNLWDIRRPWAKLTGQVWSGYQDPTHINLMTPRRLSTLMRQAGFEGVRWKTGIKPWVSRSVRKLNLTVGLPYPPAIGNGIMAVGRAPKNGIIN